MLVGLYTNIASPWNRDNNGEVGDLRERYYLLLDMTDSLYFQQNSSRNRSLTSTSVAGRWRGRVHAPPVANLANLNNIRNIAGKT